MPVRRSVALGIAFACTIIFGGGTAVAATPHAAPAAVVSRAPSHAAAKTRPALRIAPVTPIPSGDELVDGRGEGARVYDATTFNYKTVCGGQPCVNNGHRSPNSYNRLFAAGTTSFGGVTDPANPARNWFDVACSGALIGDFYSTNPTGNCPDEPGQQSVLSSGTSLVTVTMGGNDLGFAPVIQACILPPRTCQATYDAQIRADVTSLSDPTNSGGWPQLFAAIKRAAPQAEVVVLGYPHILLPGTSSSGLCVADGWIAGRDRDWLNQMAGLIDSGLQSAAASAGVDYLSTDSLFNGHELCSSSPWFTGVLDPNSNDTQSGEENFVQSASLLAKQEWFHPNAAGYQAEAALLASHLPVP